MNYKKEEILKDFRLCCLSRMVSKHIRTDVLSGKAKFGIESAGKELLQIAMARNFQKGDFFSGYYRDQTFMMKLGIADAKSIFSSLYGDTQNDLFSGGRQMNNHFSTPTIDDNGEWLNLKESYNVASAMSSLAAQFPHALGLAFASKKYRAANPSNSTFTNKGNEVSFCTIGDAATSEGVFFETVNAASVLQVPLVIVIQDDGYGISVPTAYQTAKGSISEALRGFEKEYPDQKACDIHVVKAWDYEALLETFEKAVATARKDHSPCIIHVTECTQINGHSTSGSHERYKPAERLQWEKDMDCLVHFEDWILKNKFASKADLDKIREEIKTTFKADKKQAWVDFQKPFQQHRTDLQNLLTNLKTDFPNNHSIETASTTLSRHNQGFRAEVLELAETVIFELIGQQSDSLEQLKAWYDQANSAIQQTYETHLYSQSSKAAINQAIVPVEYTEDAKNVNGYQILNKYFDQLFERHDNVYAFGEDVGKIGGVNQGFAGLQAKYGEERIFDVGIREWTIVGQAIGMAMRGLRPIAEIQYLDYLVYALPALTDDLACMRWRTNGKQQSPVIIRTRGHRLEGIWHSGSPISMMLGSLRGIYLLTPRNMTQAVGMYNTLMQSDDPAILIECLNGYRRKEKMPSNLDSFTVPLGSPEVLETGEDITLVTYGSCVAIAQEAVDKLKTKDISVELIDVQTLLPFDLEHRIVESVKKTSRVIFLDEDVPGGGTAYMMQEVLEKQEAFRYLDASPVCISAKAHRPPFGDDGNYAGKPMVFDVVKAALNIMYESAPNQYVKF